MPTYTTYGTRRVYLRIPGRYHEPLVFICDTVADAEGIAKSLNRKLESYA